jgi:diguanylate cyclase (GGDEF)-like protein
MGMMAEVWARMRGTAVVERDAAVVNWKPERDSLTQLWSRNALEATMQTTWAHATRRSGQLTLWIIQVDGIVYFGSPTARSEADRLIVNVARTLEAIAGPDDTVFRLSGASFAVLLPGRDAIGAARFSALARTEVLAALASVAQGPSLAVRACAASSHEVANGAELISLATTRLASALKSVLPSRALVAN